MATTRYFLYFFSKYDTFSVALDALRPAFIILATFKNARDLNTARAITLRRLRHNAVSPSMSAMLKN